MADEDQVSVELSLELQEGLAKSMDYLAQNCLGDDHYNKLQNSLSSKWDRFQSLSAAMKLMEQYGVELSPEEEQQMKSLGEAQMIDALVGKMPQQSKEQFQTFFLQLQNIVSTATQVRQALADGQTDLVEQAVEEAGKTGIAQYILKMALVQVGSEVANLTQQHQAFVKDSQQQMSKSLRGQEDLMAAKKKLATAQQELSKFQVGQNEKTKQVLMSLASGSGAAFLHAILLAWSEHTKRMKQESLIYEEYREAIEAAEQRLIDARASQLASVRRVLMKKAEEGDKVLVETAFNVFKEDVLEAKRDRENEALVKELEEKLSGCAASQAENAKKVMARMGAASESALVSMCWQSWLAFSVEYKKDKETEDAVKAAELRVQEYLKGQSGQKQGLLSKMSGATDTGLVHTVWTAWVQVFLDEKQSREMAEILASRADRLGGFGARGKQGAKSVMERAKMHLDMIITLRLFNAWRLETKVEKQTRAFQSRLDGKRAQLSGVQKLFRDFAVQLENGIKAGADTDRDLAAGPPHKFKKQLTRNEGAVSLPDIRSQQSAQAGRSYSRDGGGSRMSPNSNDYRERPAPKGAWH